MPSAVSVCAACCIVSQSDVLPMMMPISALAIDPSDKATPPHSANRKLARDHRPRFFRTDSVNLPRNKGSFVPNLFFSMKRFARSLTFPTALLALGLTGCSTVNLDSTGDTQATYQLGEFKMIVNTTSGVAATATQKAFKDLDLFQIKSVINPYDAELQARSRDDKKVSVTIAEINSRQTIIKIRWGVGAKANSQELYQRIERNLSK
jgi:hypothetical protein